MPKDDAAWALVFFRGKELRLARRRAKGTAIRASPRLVDAGRGRGCRAGGGKGGKK